SCSSSCMRPLRSLVVMLPRTLAARRRVYPSGPACAGDWTKVGLTVTQLSSGIHKVVTGPAHSDPASQPSTQEQGMKLKSLMAALTIAATAPTIALAAVDPALPGYQKQATGVSGNLSSVGSDSLANLMTLWAEAFKQHYPSVNVQIQAAGSSTAPPALTEGTANLGPMSRPMKDSEIQAFERKHGYRPTAVPVAIDAL